MKCTILATPSNGNKPVSCECDGLGKLPFCSLDAIGSTDKVPVKIVLSEFVGDLFTTVGHVFGLLSGVTGGLGTIVLALDDVDYKATVCVSGKPGSDGKCKLG